MEMEEYYKIRRNRVSVTLEERKIIVPTMYYPLNTNNFEVFTYQNTSIIQDKAVLDIIDSVPYQMGHCYQNTAAICQKLQAKGYDAKSYAGWLFVSGENGFQTPIHHCWTVLKIGDSISLIDLSDEFTEMYGGKNGENWEGCTTKEESLEVLKSWTKFAKGLPNSKRCYPIGKATSILLYIGEERIPELARADYRNLMRQFPDHECEQNVDAEGLNATQRYLIQ